MATASFRRFVSRSVTCALAALLVACGGGGGGDTVPPVVVATAPVAVTVIDTMGRLVEIGRASCRERV